MSEQEADDPTTIGTESGRVALRRRRDDRTDHVHDIPFGERVEVTCPGCGESIEVGIYGNTTARSYSRCWTWDCDDYHKFRRDRDAETDDTEQSNEIVQTKLVTDGGVDQDTEEIDPTAGCRDGFHLECPISDCIASFTGDDLAQIAKNGARHWNKEHGDKLKRRYDALDEVVTGGHHIQGNAYEVRKYKVYITAFDVMDRIGQIDGRLVRADNTKTCRECLCEIPDRDERIEEEPDSAFNDEWTCSECLDEQEIERRAEQNRDLTEFKA